MAVLFCDPKPSLIELLSTLRASLRSLNVLETHCGDALAASELLPLPCAPFGSLAGNAAAGTCVYHVYICSHI